MQFEHKTGNFKIKAMLLAGSLAIAYGASSFVYAQPPGNEPKLRPRLTYGNGDPIIHLAGKARVNVIDILSNDMAIDDSTPDFLERFHLLVYLHLTDQQREKLVDRFDPFSEANRIYRVQVHEKMSPALAGGNKELFEEYHALIGQACDEMEEFCRDFGYYIAEVLTTKQLETLKAMVITSALKNIGDLDAIFKRSMKDHEVDVTKLEQDRQFHKKVIAIKQRYQERLMELQKESMEEFLAILPPESRAAMEFTLGIDTLTRTKPGGNSEK